GCLRIHADNPQFEIRNPKSNPGLWSELRFRLRRPLGILTGTIDKLLITPANNGNGFDVEIIDFKTNRFSSPTKRTMEARAAVVSETATTVATHGARQTAQGRLNFESVSEEMVIQETRVEAPELLISIEEQLKTLAADYQLQMRAYALALR